MVDAGAAAALQPGQHPAAGRRRIASRATSSAATCWSSRAQDGRELARGLSAYAVEDARRIMGHNSREIADFLGYRGRTEMIHRDDLVLS